MSMRKRATLSALDALEKFLDDRDVEDSKRLDMDGMSPNKGSEANLDEDDGGLGDKSTPDEDDDTSSTQKAEDFGQSDEGESGIMKDDDASAEDGEGESDGFMEELKKMSSSNPSAANAHDMLLEDDEDETLHDDDLKKKKKDDEED